jgi:hypothetical protein
MRRHVRQKAEQITLFSLGWQLTVGNAAISWFPLLFEHFPKCLLYGTVLQNIQNSCQCPFVAPQKVSQSLQPHLRACV